MKSIVLVAFALVAVVAALPVDEKKVEIVQSEYERKPDGSYNSEVETSDGTHRSEHGELKEVLDEDKKPHTVLVVKGSYSYIKEDGTQENISYSADENGYHPEGPSIPKTL